MPMERQYRLTMPEGPEIRLTSLYINTVCKGLLFSGHPVRSEVSKNPPVIFDSPQYNIKSESRGKELALILTCQQNPTGGITKRLLFRFGMSGRFILTSSDDLPKHAHLSFFSTPPKDTNALPYQLITSTKAVLCFVDTRRFGSWESVNDDEWGPNRGPDPMEEYDSFRCNIESHLDSHIFDKPICEVMLNQKYFNGVGNYLRAEILYRTNVPPFLSARDALSMYPVILDLCHSVPFEVVNLKTELGKSSDAVVSGDNYKQFLSWLQCYENPLMNNLVDHNNRTIWFQGEPGPLVPKVKKSRGKIKQVKTMKKSAVKTKGKIKQKAVKMERVLPTEYTISAHQNTTTRRVTRSMTKK